MLGVTETLETSKDKAFRSITQTPSAAHTSPPRHLSCNAMGTKKPLVLATPAVEGWQLSGNALGRGFLQLTNPDGLRTESAEARDADITQRIHWQTSSFARG